MSYERDELAKLLGNHESMGCGCCAYGPTTPEQSKAADELEVSDYMVVLAEAVLAAGYLKVDDEAVERAARAVAEGFGWMGEPHELHKELARAVIAALKEQG